MKEKINIIDFLTVFEELTYIVVYIKGEDDPVFEGCIFDFPIGYRNCYLDVDGLEEGGAVSVRTKVGKSTEGLVICIAED